MGYGCPLGLGLVVEDKPTQFSCNVHIHGPTYACMCVHFICNVAVNGSLRLVRTSAQHPATLLR